MDAKGSVPALRGSMPTSVSMGSHEREKSINIMLSQSESESGSVSDAEVSEQMESPSSLIELMMRGSGLLVCAGSRACAVEVGSTRFGFV